MALPRVEPLGALATHGYRVVYENTEIVDVPEDPANYVRFLQGSDVLGGVPIVEEEAMGWVSRADWERYAMGRIEPGEILIEVKGKAEKVAIVPDDFPYPETLVSGTLFKLSVDQSKVNPYYVVAYLLSKFGRGLRNRYLTNTLIGYVSKEDLYSLPVPVLDRVSQERAAGIVRSALEAHATAVRRLQEVEALVTEALGAASVPSPSLTYEASFQEVTEAGRLDAQFFQPSKRQILSRLGAHASSTVGQHFVAVRDLIDPARPSTDQMVRNYDLSDAFLPFLDDMKPPVPIHEVGSSKKRLADGDLVVSRLRSYLKQIAIVANGSDIPALGSTEFIVLRPLGSEISPQCLMAFLRSPQVQTVLEWSQDGSNHPRFDDSVLTSIPLPSQLFDLDSVIQELVDDIIRLRRLAHDEVARATDYVEHACGG